MQLFVVFCVFCLCFLLLHLCGFFLVLILFNLHLLINLWKYGWNKRGSSDNIFSPLELNRKNENVFSNPRDVEWMEVQSCFIVSFFLNRLNEHSVRRQTNHELNRKKFIRTDAGHKYSDEHMCNKFKRIVNSISSVWLCHCALCILFSFLFVLFF